MVLISVGLVTWSLALCIWRFPVFLFLRLIQIFDKAFLWSYRFPFLFEYAFVGRSSSCFTLVLFGRVYDGLHILSGISRRLLRT